MTKQLTLGELLDAIDALDPSMPVHVAGFGAATTPFGFGRHRKHTDGLAIHVFHDRSGEWSVKRLAGRLRQRLVPGYAQDFTATLHTPIWAQPAGELQFNAVTGVEVRKGRAVVRSENIAPQFGPSLQRIPDDDAINRMRDAGAVRTGDTVSGAPTKVERWLLRCMPSERTAALARLEEARSELTRYESRLAELKTNVVDAEATAVEIDYILGITDELEPPVH